MVMLHFLKVKTLVNVMMYMKVFVPFQTCIRINTLTTIHYNANALLKS